jgi:hypothetical protein
MRLFLPEGKKKNTAFLRNLADCVCVCVCVCVYSHAGFRRCYPTKTQYVTDTLTVVFYSHKVF